MPHLMEKKKKLEDIRNFYKPLDKKELMEHNEKYQKYKNIKLEEIMKARDESKEREKEHYQNLKYKA